MTKNALRYFAVFFTFLIISFQIHTYSNEIQQEKPFSTEISPIIVTLPKAGTHLVRTIIEHFLKKEGIGPIPFLRKPFYPKHQFLNLHVTEAASLIESYCREYPNCPKILVVRNLRDIVVSAKDFITKTGFYNFVFFAELFAKSINYTKNYDKIKGNKELKKIWDSLSNDDKLTQFIQYYYNFKKSPDQFMAHNLLYYVQDSIHFLQKYPDTLVVRFEDLFDENECISVKELRKIATFLGKNVSHKQLIKMSKEIYGHSKSRTYRIGKKVGRSDLEFKKQHVSLFKSYFETEEKEFNSYFGYPDPPPPSDIDYFSLILVTIPKSGTRLLTNLIQQILPGYPLTKFHVQRRNAIKQHCNQHPKCLKILMVRNLRDLILSRTDYTSREGVVKNHPPFLRKHGKQAWDSLPKQKKLSKIIDWFYEFKQVDFRRHNLCHYVKDSIWFKESYPEALVLRFEDFFDAQDHLKKASVSQLAHYLGQNLSQKSIEQILSQVDQNKEESATYRKEKKANRYLEEFDLENNIKFLHYFEDLEKEYNAVFGYDFFLNEMIAN